MEPCGLRPEHPCHPWCEAVRGFELGNGVNLGPRMTYSALVEGAGVVVTAGALSGSVRWPRQLLEESALRWFANPGAETLTQPSALTDVLADVGSCATWGRDGRRRGSRCSASLAKRQHTSSVASRSCGVRETSFGTFRAKELILEVYDAMQAAIDSSQPYASPFDDELSAASTTMGHGIADPQDGMKGGICYDHRSLRNSRQHLRDTRR